MIAVAEAARNVVCSGATPIALTDCLNFGNPERPDVYFQLEEAIKGMSAACEAFGIPVISGNVSLFNETAGKPIYPTPVVGMLGLIDDINKHCTMGFKAEGDAIYLIGANLYDPKCSTADGLAGSEYLAYVYSKVVGQPTIDLDLELQVQALCLDAIGRGIARSAHDCSDGGLSVALAESCIAGDIGMNWERFPDEGRIDSILFGEQQSRIILSVAPEHADELVRLAKKAGVPYTNLGKTGGTHLTMGSILTVAVSDLRDRWERGLAQAAR